MRWRPSPVLVVGMVAGSATAAIGAAGGYVLVDLGPGPLAGATLEYRVNPMDPDARGAATATFNLTVPAEGRWVGFAFNDGDRSMRGSEAVIGVPEVSDGEVKESGQLLVSSTRPVPISTRLAELQWSGLAKQALVASVPH